MVIFPSLRKNILLLSALLCAAVLYLPLLLGKALPVRSRTFRCLLPRSEIRTLEGVIASDPVRTSSGSYRASISVRRASSAAASSEASGLADVFLPAPLVEAWYPGRLYTARPGAPSPILLEKGARVRLSVDGGSSFYASGAADAPGAGGLLSLPGRFRALCRLYFRRLMYGWGEAGALVLALLTGAREYLSGAVSAAFISAGLSPVLALSGMHVTILASFARGAGRLFSARFSAGLQLLFVCVFVWFAGFSPSLLRAFLCTLLGVLASALRLRRPPFSRILAASFLLHTAVMPAHVYTFSFMLSYAALSGIALLSPLIRRHAVRLLPHGAATALSDSVAASLVSSPLSAMLFSRVALFGALAMAVMSPLTGFFMYAALCGICISLAFPFLSPLVRDMMQVVYALIKAAAEFFARFPAVTFR